MNRALLELQEIDNTLAALTREKTALDNGMAARGARDTLEKAVNAAVAHSQKIAAERSARELELKSAEEKIARQQSRLMSASSPHEITALQRDIEALSKARGDLDETLLNLMDEGETQNAHLNTFQGQLKSARDEVASVEARFTSETTRLERELTAIRQERVEAEKALSPAECEKFAAFAKKFGGIAVSKVVKGNCSACGAAILQFTLNEAKSQQFPTCEGCGRLIFIA